MPGPNVVLLSRVIISQERVSFIDSAFIMTIMMMSDDKIY
jgi:hypothetical protein